MSNMPVVVTLSETSQHRYWSKVEAPKIAFCMVVTELMFHELRS